MTNSIENSMQSLKDNFNSLPKNVDTFIDQSASEVCQMRQEKQFDFWGQCKKVWKSCIMYLILIEIFECLFEQELQKNNVSYTPY